MKPQLLGERDLQRRLPAIIQSRLPSGWTTTVSETGTGPIDLVLRVASPNRTVALVPVHIVPKLEPKYARYIIASLSNLRTVSQSEHGLVGATYLSPKTRQLLKDAGLSYVDSTGNIRLVLESPAVFIEVASSAPPLVAIEPSREIRSLKGPASGRVVRALVDFRPPYGIQQLAERSGTPISTVSRAIDFLDRQALLTREKRGPVLSVQWSELLRRWVDDYDFASANQIYRSIEPRGLQNLLANLREAPFRYAITGSLGATAIAPITSARLGMVYVDDIETARQHLGLRPVEVGANVILARAFDPVVFDRTWQRDGLRYAALSQVTADLLTSPGRGPAEGNELISWMETHEDEWRT